MSLGLYLHIPYCLARCRYCDFYSRGGQKEVPDAYVDALAREMARWGNCDCTALRPDTLYFGGGTPSLLRPAQAARLVDQAAPAPEDGCAPAEDVSEEEGARVTASGPCWDDVVSHLKGRVPVGYWNLLTDPLQVRGEFTDAGLHVAIAKGFAANMLTKPDMMDKFRAAAAEIMGHGVPVNVTEMDSDEKIATRSIEELRRFKEVKFT